MHSCVYEGHKYINLVQISSVAIEIQGVENVNLAVPVNTLHTCEATCLSWPIDRHKILYLNLAINLLSILVKTPYPQVMDIVYSYAVTDSYPVPLLEFFWDIGMHLLCPLWGSTYSINAIFHGKCICS